MSCVAQKLSCKASCKTPIFSHTVWEKKRHLKKTRIVHSQCLSALSMQKHFWFVSSFDHVNFAINGKKLWQSKLLCFTCDLSNIQKCSFKECPLTWVAPLIVFLPLHILGCVIVVWSCMIVHFFRTSTIGCTRFDAFC
jgi:hypothetical protein